MGVDMWAAELLLRMKEQQAYQDVELCLACLLYTSRCV